MRASEDRHALQLEPPWAPAIVSLAGAARDGPAAPATASRSRPRPPQASDLLLLASDAALPADLDEAVARARPTARVRPREEVGVYFELYPPMGADTAGRFSVLGS